MDVTAKITKSLRKEDVDKKWWAIDAEGKVLGRVASQAAALLRGKHKPEFTPHVDCGDNVIILNADKVKVTGKRYEKKEYFTHTGYIGNERITSYKEMMGKKPEFVITHAVKGMIPKNRLGRKIMKHLRVYSGTEHPHEAQKPETYEIKK